MNEQASRKRLLLAVYIDFLFFTALWEPIAWVVRSQGIELRWAAGLVAFAALDWVVVRFLGTSPGSWALGIVRDTEGPSVEHTLRTREAWWTMLLGTLLVLEGSKNLVRWTQGLPPLPIFTSGPDELAFVAISVLGIANMAAGLLALRCRPIGPLIALGGSALAALAYAVSWPRIDSWIARRVEVRRALQGREVRADEIELMQAMFPKMVIILSFIAVFWLCTELAKGNVATSYPEYEDWRKLFGRDKPPFSEASKLVSEIQRLLESEPSVASLRWLYPA